MLVVNSLFISVIHLWITITLKGHPFNCEPILETVTLFTTVFFVKLMNCQSLISQVTVIVTDISENRRLTTLPNNFHMCGLVEIFHTYQPGHMWLPGNS